MGPTGKGHLSLATGKSITRCQQSRCCMDHCQAEQTHLDCSFACASLFVIFAMFAKCCKVVWLCMIAAVVEAAATFLASMPLACAHIPPHINLETKLTGCHAQVFNQYLMQPSHGTAFQSAYAHLRILDIDVWVNSKIFFRSRRAMYLPGATSRAQLPVMVHMNYVSLHHWCPCACFLSVVLRQNLYGIMVQMWHI